MKQGFALLIVAACSSSSSSRPAQPVAATVEEDRGIAGVAPAEDCDGLVEVTVTPEAVELDRVARAIPRRKGAIDLAALRREMEPADAAAPCAKMAAIGARGDVTYEDLMAVMNEAVEAGRRDVGLVGGSTAMYPTPRRLEPTDEEFYTSLARPQLDPATTPILIITTTTVMLKLRAGGAEREVVIDDDAPLGDEAAMQSLQETLREARTAAGYMQDALVLQAERAVPAKLVIDASGASRAAGYNNILFAVQRSHTP